MEQEETPIREATRAEINQHHQEEWEAGVL